MVWLVVVVVLVVVAVGVMEDGWKLREHHRDADHRVNLLVVVEQVKRSPVRFKVLAVVLVVLVEGVFHHRLVYRHRLPFCLRHQPVVQEIQ